METVGLKVWRGEAEGEGQPQEFRVPKEERATVLSALMYIQEHLDPSLSFRYGCRYERCGLCGVEIDGHPRLACLTTLKEGMTVKPLSRVPLIRDLTVDRAWLYGTLQKLDLYVEPEEQEGFRVLQEPAEHVEVENCVECFGCLGTCPSYDYRTEGAGGPLHFVKLAQMHFHPLNKRDRKAQAAVLKVDRCADCRKCYCTIGIKIYDMAIAPLEKREKKA